MTLRLPTNLLVDYVKSILRKSRNTDFIYRLGHDKSTFTINYLVFKENSKRNFFTKSFLYLLKDYRGYLTLTNKIMITIFELTINITDYKYMNYLTQDIPVFA